jgi:hypothetical protein
MTKPPQIMLATGFLARRHYHKVVRQEMAGLGLEPLDVVIDGISVFDEPGPTSVSSELMRRADAYLAIIDTQYVMTRIRS